MSLDLPVHPWCEKCGDYLVAGTCDRCSELPAPAGSAIGPFQVYENYEHALEIIDGNTRRMLSDIYAYDETPEARTERMEWIAQALTDAWLAATTGDNMPVSPNDQVERPPDSAAPTGQ